MEKLTFNSLWNHKLHAEAFGVKSLLFRQGVVGLSPGIYKIKLDILTDKAIAFKIKQSKNSRDSHTKQLKVAQWPQR